MDRLPLLEQLQRRVRVARGLEPADVVLTGGQVVNVFAGRLERWDVAVADGVIAGVGPFAWQGRDTIDATGKVVLPGLIDSHMHLESTLLSPGELARLVVPRGTTATISDSHEVGNVLGIPGIEALAKASEGIAFDLFFTASSCVPAAAWEHAGATLDPDDVARLLRHPRMLALAEVMDFPAVLRSDPYVLRKVLAGMEAGRPLDGHAPGMVGRDLVAYAAAGIRSDHESGTVEEAVQKAALGMLVQVREGSIARNLDALLPSLVRGELGDCWTLVTDDVLPTDLIRDGHLDHHMRRVVAAGVDPVVAVRQASFVPARHYRLFDRGAVAPGYRADLVVVERLGNFRPTLVLKDGVVAARDGVYVGPQPTHGLPKANTIHLPALTEAAFRLKLGSDSVPALRIQPGSLLTRKDTVEVARNEGHWAYDPRRDVVLLASVERHKALGTVGLGLATGFGFRRHGALGSSVAHDSHNVILAGTNPRDLLVAAHALAETGGGFVTVADGQVQARLPLPFAGLLSTRPYEEVEAGLSEVESAAAELGVTVPCPFGILSFLALSVIPEVRVTDQGFWDVVEQRFVTLG